MKSLGEADGDYKVPCLSRKSVLVDYIEVFAAMRNPCSHGFTDPFSILNDG